MCVHQLYFIITCSTKQTLGHLSIIHSSNVYGRFLKMNKKNEQKKNYPPKNANSPMSNCFTPLIAHHNHITSRHHTTYIPKHHTINTHAPHLDLGFDILIQQQNIFPLGQKIKHFKWPRINKMKFFDESLHFFFVVAVVLLLCMNSTHAISSSEKVTSRYSTYNFSLVMFPTTTGIPHFMAEVPRGEMITTSRYRAWVWLDGADCDWKNTSQRWGPGNGGCLQHYTSTYAPMRGQTFIWIPMHREAIPRPGKLAVLIATSSDSGKNWSVANKPFIVDYQPGWSASSPGDAFDDDAMQLVPVDDITTRLVHKHDVLVNNMTLRQRFDANVLMAHEYVHLGEVVSFYFHPIDKFGNLHPAPGGMRFNMKLRLPNDNVKEQVWSLDCPNGINPSSPTFDASRTSCTWVSPEVGFLIKIALQKPTSLSDTPSFGADHRGMFVEITPEAFTPARDLYQASTQSFHVYNFAVLNEAYPYYRFTTPDGNVIADATTPAAELGQTLWGETVQLETKWVALGPNHVAMPPIPTNHSSTFWFTEPILPLLRGDGSGQCDWIHNPEVTNFQDLGVVTDVATNATTHYYRYSMRTPAPYSFDWTPMTYHINNPNTNNQNDEVVDKTKHPMVKWFTPLSSRHFAPIYTPVPSEMLVDVVSSFEATPPQFFYNVTNGYIEVNVTADSTNTTTTDITQSSFTLFSEEEEEQEQEDDTINNSTTPHPPAHTTAFVYTPPRAKQVEIYTTTFRVFDLAGFAVEDNELVMALTAKDLLLVNSTACPFLSVRCTTPGAETCCDASGLCSIDLVKTLTSPSSPLPSHTNTTCPTPQWGVFERMITRNTTTGELGQWFDAPGAPWANTPALPSPTTTTAATNNITTTATADNIATEYSLPIYEWRCGFGYAGVNRTTPQPTLISHPFFVMEKNNNNNTDTNNNNNTNPHTNSTGGIDDIIEWQEEEEEQEQGEQEENNNNNIIDHFYCHNVNWLEQLANDNLCSAETCHFVLQFMQCVDVTTDPMTAVDDEHCLSYQANLQYNTHHTIMSPNTTFNHTFPACTGGDNGDDDANTADPSVEMTMMRMSMMADQQEQQQMLYCDSIKPPTPVDPTPTPVDPTPTPGPNTNPNPNSNTAMNFTTSKTLVLFGLLATLALFV